MVSPTHYKCYAKVVNPNYPNQPSISKQDAYRYGDNCPIGTTEDASTGLCEATCSDTVGESLLVRGDDAVVINSNGTNYVASQAPESICSLSCSYAPVSNFSASCYLVAGSTSTGYCNYIVEGTGDTCSGSNLVAGDTSGDPLNPVDPGDGSEPEEPDPCHGVPGYEWDGSTCVKTDGEGGGDGSGDGGDGSGDGDGDGSGDGDGGDGSGDGGSGGDGDGGGSGDGDGDGSGGGGGGSGDGGCTGEDCGEGEGGGLNRPEKGNFEEAIAEYEQKITDTLAEIKDQSGQFGSLIEQKMTIPLNSGNAVLPCFEAEVVGRTVGFCLSDNADQLAILRNILLFLATVIALFIIFREDK
ncbi:attachment protein [Halopseudomonas maritima]|uniref:attachment protein n=1 Tax=Halopseudomonas maritima TaxID=2918528 RepID=UPI001EE9F487|nr:attachment protein [Halopseudomonas maritima]UJJ32336.1 attachment protein [Halopseudomonas maritima]